MALRDVTGQMQVNEKLVLLTDMHKNFKKKASATIFECEKAIAAQRDKETEFHKQRGLDSHMSKLQSTATTLNWKRYHQIADKPSSYRTPTLSDMSSPD